MDLSSLIVTLATCLNGKQYTSFWTTVIVISVPLVGSAIGVFIAYLRRITCALEVLAKAGWQILPTGLDSASMNARKEVVSALRA